MQATGLRTAVAFVLLLAACSVSIANQDSVEIPGPAAADQKLELAQEVATAVWNSGLPARIHEQFPSLSEEELRGLGVRWNRTTFAAFNGPDKGKARTQVVILCVFSHGREVGPVADRIVQACKREMQAALQKRLATPSA
jgi:hypothetical protein